MMTKKTTILLWFALGFSTVAHMIEQATIRRQQAALHDSETAIRELSAADARLKDADISLQSAADRLMQEESELRKTCGLPDTHGVYGTVPEVYRQVQ